MTTATQEERTEEGREIMRRRQEENDVEKVMTERTMTLCLTITRFKTETKVKKETVDKMLTAITVDPTKGDDDAVHVGKTLLKHPIIKNITDTLSALRETIRTKAEPVAFLKGGMYLYSTAKIEWAEKTIAEAETRVQGMLDDLAGQYEGIVKADKERLEPRGLFDAGDYPSIATLRRKVTVRYWWAQFSTPTNLKNVAPAVWEAERQKARAFWAEMYNGVRSAHRQILADFVDGLLATLRPGEDGKKKVLKQARIDKMQKFLREFRLDDITGDEDAAKLADKVAGILDGVDAEVIRTEDGYRARLDKTMAEVQTVLKPLVIDAARKVKLKD